jgi:hypothetical protein
MPDINDMKCWRLLDSSHGRSEVAVGSPHSATNIAENLTEIV